MKRFRHSIGSVCALFLLLCSATPLWSAGDRGAVDWSGGYVTAVGYGTAPPGIPAAKALLSARRAAEIDAQRALLETIKGVQIDTQTTIDGSMRRDVVTRTRVEGALRGAVITKQEVTVVNGAPMATVTMRLCLDGRSADCAGKAVLVSAINLDRFAGQDAGPAQPLVPGDPTPREPARYDPARPATGAILVLGSQRFERVLLPVVITSQNGESILVYGVRRVAPEVVRTFGIVRYAASLEQARGMEAAGTNPVVIVAEAVSPDNRIIIAPRDAATLEETLRYGNNFLEKGRMVIVQ